MICLELRTFLSHSLSLSPEVTPSLLRSFRRHISMNKKKINTFHPRVTHTQPYHYHLSYAHTLYAIIIDPAAMATAVVAM